MPRDGPRGTRPQAHCPLRWLSFGQGWVKAEVRGPLRAVCMHVCAHSGGRAGQPRVEESLSLAEGLGCGWKEPRWASDSRESLNHIGAAMGRLPGAWREGGRHRLVI